MRIKGKIKDNSRKSGDAAAKKERKRIEAIARNELYQTLSFEEKLSRNSDKVRSKLMNGGRNENERRI